MMEITNTLHSGMCRCCASEGTFKDIKTKYHWMGEEEVYADMLTDCFDIKICTPEDLDNGICEVCITQLRNAANFKKQVLHTEEQFKRRLQLKDVKNPIKLESVDEDPIESDHVSDPDFSGTEYEVPIKQEVDEKPKPRKRPAKATTSRAKKPKVEPESSKKRNPGLLDDRTVNQSRCVETQMDTEDDVIATLVKRAEKNKYRLLEEQATVKNKASGDDTQSSSHSDSEFTFNESDSRSSFQSIDTNDPALPTNSGDIEELELSSNIEYLDETEEEFRLSESIQKSKRITESQQAKADKSVNKNIKKKAVIEELENPNDNEVQYHHDNLRTVLRCSNATTFLCRGVWYQCTLCRTKYTHPGDLKEHTLKAHNTLKSQRKLYSARKMKRYVIKLDITNLKCKLCSTEISSLKDLMEHLHSEHGEKIHMNLQNHMIPFKFDSDVLRCTECDREFAFFKMLQCHMNDHYKNYTCEVCNTNYVSYGSLIQHMRSHADGEYTCQFCEKIFFNKHKLTDHIKLVHFGQNMRNKCAYCDMKFLLFEARNKHMEEEHGLKAPVVQCQACNKTFRSTRHLTAHMKSFHLIAGKNHECSMCDKRFSALHMLKEHMTVHSNEKNYKCVVCDKAFSRKKTLREHIRIHANDRRFKCEFCGMAFVQKCSLTGHLKSKHSDKVSDGLLENNQK